MRLRELQVRAAKHVCSSFSVVVCSRTLKILDDRIDSPAPPDTPPIINIGQDLPTASSGLRHVDSLAVRHQSRKLTTMQQVHVTLPHKYLPHHYGQMIICLLTDVNHSQLGQGFNPPRALGRLSSLKWEPLGSAANHNSYGSRRRSADSTGTDVQSAGDGLVSLHSRQECQTEIP